MATVACPFLSATTPTSDSIKHPDPKTWRIVRRRRPARRSKSFCKAGLAAIDAVTPNVAPVGPVRRHSPLRSSFAPGPWWHFGVRIDARAEGGTGEPGPSAYPRAITARFGGAFPSARRVRRSPPSVTTPADEPWIVRWSGPLACEPEGSTTQGVQMRSAGCVHARVDISPQGSLESTNDQPRLRRASKSDRLVSGASRKRFWSVPVSVQHPEPLRQVIADQERASRP